uniref:NADH-ubiquinone oxidoreductase chain 4 n=1 Tax=Vollenhovia emeryi TaxID=411798 RepID=A0A160DR40_VOLEM|nr:NADH dehydrogenase subunit 4 [Vollenhovia emeryi]ANA91974.1 NADH dehydrogenase subunit 4 [Vollenhovia emeryi]
MMKFIFMFLFMIFMMVGNKLVSFYFNLCYFMSFMVVGMYMYKDILWGAMSGGFGIDYYSIWLMILSIWILGLMMMCMGDTVDIIKMLVFLMLLVILVMFFISLDLFWFYFMFEVSLIPTFFLIIYWGSNVERLGASFYLMLYMMMISFPFLVYVYKIGMWGFTFKFSLMGLFLEYYNFSIWSFLMIFMSFFIKLPIYMFHIWLPKAHVEAPVYGSMILAGVLLKMGGYGLIRFFSMFIYGSVKFGYLVFSVSLIGSIFAGVICLVQIDMKSLVAYSSVVHMNFMLCSLLTYFKSGVVGSYIIMLSHGLCSSGMFYMVNLYYERSFSRLMFLNKGMLSKMPLMALFWFLLSIINFSFPFCMNFISEILTLMVLLNWDNFILLNLMMVCFISSAYSLYLYSYIQHNYFSYSENVYNFGVCKEYLVLIIHVYPLIFFMLNLVVFM